MTSTPQTAISGKTVTAAGNAAKVYAVGEKRRNIRPSGSWKKQGCNVCGATVFDRLHEKREYG